MPDGSVIKGAQGNFSPQRMFAWRVRRDAAKAKDKEQYLAWLCNFEKQGHCGPAALRSDPDWQIDHMSIDEIAFGIEAFFSLASRRERGSSLHAIHDLI
jgi:hypothetical protein